MYMKIEKKFLKKNHMTRCLCKLKEVRYILIKDFFSKKVSLDEEYSYIINLESQDEIYYSVHFLIGVDGKCVNIIPEDEVTYSTRNIELNYYVISIECCINENGEFSLQTIDTLIKLINFLKKKYNISKDNILLDNDLTGSRNPIFYVDNRYKFLEILEKIS